MFLEGNLLLEEANVGPKWAFFIKTVPYSGGLLKKRRLNFNGSCLILVYESGEL